MLCLSPLLIVKLVTDVYLLSGRVVQTKNTAVSEIRLEMDLMYFYIVCTCFVRDCSLLKLLLSGSPISMPHCSCMFSHCQKLSASNLRSCTRYYHSGGCDNTDLLTQVRTISWTWQLFGSILLPVTSTCCPRLKLFRWRHIVLPRFFVYLGHLSLYFIHHASPGSISTRHAFTPSKLWYSPRSHKRYARPRFNPAFTGLRTRCGCSRFIKSNRNRHSRARVWVCLSICSKVAHQGRQCYVGHLTLLNIYKNLTIRIKRTIVARHALQYLPLVQQQTIGFNSRPRSSRQWS